MRSASDRDAALRSIVTSTSGRSHVFTSTLPSKVPTFSVGAPLTAKRFSMVSMYCALPAEMSTQPATEEPTRAITSMAARGVGNGMRTSWQRVGPRDEGLDGRRRRAVPLDPPPCIHEAPTHVGLHDLAGAV